MLIIKIMHWYLMFQARRLGTPVASTVVLDFSKMWHSKVVTRSSTDKNQDEYTEDRTAVTYPDRSDSRTRRRDEVLDVIRPRRTGTSAVSFVSLRRNLFHSLAACAPTTDGCRLCL
jgi:hypothetical protein